MITGFDVVFGFQCLVSLHGKCSLRRAATQERKQCARLSLRNSAYLVLYMNDDLIIYLSLLSSELTLGNVEYYTAFTSYVISWVGRIRVKDRPL